MGRPQAGHREDGLDPDVRAILGASPPSPSSFSLLFSSLCSCRGGRGDSGGGSQEGDAQDGLDTDVRAILGMLGPLSLFALVGEAGRTQGVRPYSGGGGARKAMRRTDLTLMSALSILMANSPRSAPSSLSCPTADC